MFIFSRALILEKKQITSETSYQPRHLKDTCEGVSHVAPINCAQASGKEDSSRMHESVAR